MLCLPVSDPSIPIEGRVVSTFLIAQRSVEPAGKFYHKLMKKLSQRQRTRSQHMAESDEPYVDNDEDELKEANEAGIDPEKLKNKRRKKSLSLMKTQDHYELLGLDEDKATVTEDMIKKSYKKLAIIYHPDKYDEGKYDEAAKEKWLRVN